MATKQEIEYGLKLFHENNPRIIFDKMKNDTAGVFATLKFLDRTGGNIRATDISQELNVSTARMTVILRKLYERELITKTPDEQDGRSQLITLTPSGKEMTRNLHQQMHITIGKIIDEVGIEEFEKVFKVLAKIREFTIEQESVFLN
ncbi:hypothetical protein AN641_04695 [Candidatus Epulonipiscioides gigas]|nr:hypothetical protein AN641_04695 [Epulopiscium sp. SCG-C07WGA-EpuloA2]